MIGSALVITIVGMWVAGFLVGFSVCRLIYKNKGN